MGQQGLFLLQLLDFTFCEAEFPQFLKLKGKEFLFGRGLITTCAYVQEFFLERPPLSVDFCKAIDLGDMPRVFVQQYALVVFLQQRLVFVLVVDIDNQRAKLAQLGHGSRLPVNVAARATFSGKAPSTQAGIAVGEVVLCEPVEGGCVVAHVEACVDFHLCCALANLIRIPPITQRQA